MQKLHFSAEDSRRAEEEWGANCGPHSLAAAGGKSLEEIHTLLPGFPGWMGPPQIKKALEALGKTFKETSNLTTQTPCREGLSRIQWHGPWLRKGAAPKKAYPHTHWIAGRNLQIYDTVFPERRGTWIPLEEWRIAIGFFTKHHYPAGWHITDWLQF